MRFFYWYNGKNNVMPTTEQMDEMSQFNLHFFGGDPRITGYPKQQEPKLTGKKIGFYRYDPENDDLVIEPTSDTKPE
jgi:hypothetical protein